MCAAVCEVDGWSVVVAKDSDGETVYRLDIDDGDDREVRSFPTSAFLWRWLFLAAIDPPEGLCEAVSELPEYPDESRSVAPRSMVQRSAGRPGGAPPRKKLVSAIEMVKSDVRREFFQGDSEYHGVLWRNGVLRLAVSPNGSRYLWQVLGRNGAYRVVRWSKSLAKLSDVLPPELPSLPDDPREVSRPWAEAMAAKSGELRALNPYGDGFVGVIAVDEPFRIAISAERDQYWLQARDERSERWRVRRRGDVLRQVAEAVVPLSAPAPDISGFVVWSDRLAEAISKLPEVPAEYCREARSERA